MWHFTWLTIIGKLFQVLAICHFYEQCGRKLGLWVIWPGNNEPLKMIVIDDLSVPLLIWSQSRHSSRGLLTIRDKSIGCYGSEVLVLQEVGLGTR